ncbi:MAG: hypothetical protein FWF53_12810 [Candidatus Azobacteroides sp.]|nr:hypothetical protein [Candidatus Azobacteroides sp.]
MMRLYFISFLMVITFNGYTQIYSKKGEMEFKVVQHTSERDIIRDTLKLVLHGNLWKVYSKEESRLITLENNWSIDWIYSLTSKGKKGVIKTGEENTGIIENDSLLFMHPPRANQYAILEYCPFPQVQFPLYIGKIWSFDLKVGGIWLKAINRKVEGQTIVQSNYIMVGKISWYCPFLNKDIDCYEIRAIGNTKFGNTSLQAYFSETYGFVYLDYKTLNNDRFVLSLQSIISFTPSFQNKTWF